MPEELETYDELGDFIIKIKKEQMIHEYTYASHPFDVAGWDGYNFPYAFSIHDFEPITGRVHQPPPVHQTFETNRFVICSFCPRMYDYHPESIPAPYNHSNIDSDEVLYYVDGDSVFLQCMNDEILDQAGVLNVANLPTLDEARANIVGILNASASKLVSILLARSEKMSSLPAENSEKQPKE